MRREPRPRPLSLSSRDLQILALLGRYRLLRSSYVEAFTGGNRTALRWRLRDLYDAKLLNRPQAQWALPDARYMPLVYELASAGREVLLNVGVEPSVPTSGVVNFPHALLVSEVVASIHLGLGADVEVIHQSDIVERLRDNRGTNSARLSFPLGDGTYVIPDAMFGIRGARGVVLVAVEADRGTEPIVRAGGGSSYAAKLKNYDALIVTGLYRRLLDTPAPLVVLHVTQSARRVTRMQIAARGSAHHLFRCPETANQFGQLTYPDRALASGAWSRDVGGAITLAGLVT